MPPEKLRAGAEFAPSGSQKCLKNKIFALKWLKNEIWGESKGVKIFAPQSSLKIERGINQNVYPMSMGQDNFLSNYEL